jgi:hypothetical protein
MKIKIYLVLSAVLLVPALANSQDNSIYKLRLNAPIVDYPQNKSLKHIPSMDQALEWSNGMYELGFWGIEELGNKLFLPKTGSYKGWKKFANNAFRYALGLGFSKYASELPVPLGVWGHEEFHRSVLGVNDIESKNGNWLLNRWDGTVYGVSDLTLENFKTTDINNLLYSYVAGVQYEILLSQKITLNDFYKRRSSSKAALALYNAWYVYDYFRFSTGPESDSVKVLAPRNESKNPAERDFAGADLTAWVYDMFNPDTPFTSRDNFPDGEGVNRRIGFSDLGEEEKDYLVNQKKLALLNFLNPAIFFIDRIKINDHINFSFFTQYTPAHFGNDISLYLPVRYKKYDLLINAHRYSNRSGTGLGLGLGLLNYGFSGKLEADFIANFWDQPESFSGSGKITGGALSLTTRYFFGDSFSGSLSLTGKTKGWIAGNPYLDNNVSVQLSIGYNLIRN